MTLKNSADNDISEFIKIFKNFNKLNHNKLKRESNIDSNQYVVNNMYPLTFHQIAIIYHMFKDKFKGKLSDALIDFFQRNYKHNSLFIIDNFHELKYILLFNVDSEAKSKINLIFANRYNELKNYDIVKLGMPKSLLALKPILPIKKFANDYNLIITYF